MTPSKLFFSYLYLLLYFVAGPWQVVASAQQSPTPLVEAVDAVGMTVDDMDRSLDFYTKVLSFEPVSDVEVYETPYEQMQGVFGLRMRVVRLRLGSEFLELTEYLAPKGRPIPVDSRSNDRWFQHVAIITSDMDRAYEALRLEEDARRKKNWKRWGPYLSERAWGTVREDYSAYGTAWDYFPHDHARSKAYRWNEDGLGGICDRQQFICFALALWNGRDPILKERLLGLTGSEDNHGENVTARTSAPVIRPAGRA